MPKRLLGKERDAGNFVLDDFFPHIINRITGRIRAHFEGETKPLGVSIEKWRVLVCLLTRGPQTITTLAVLTTIELPTMSYLLKRMITQRLISHDSGVEDGRVKVIKLTDRGRSIAQEILPLVRAYETIAFAGMTDKQQKELKTLLKAILKNMDGLEQTVGGLRNAKPGRKRAGIPLGRRDRNR